VDDISRMFRDMLAADQARHELAEVGLCALEAR